MLVINYLKTQV